MLKVIASLSRPGYGRNLHHPRSDLTQSFVGAWQSSEKAEITCLVSISGNKISAIYLTGKSRRNLEGKVYGSNLAGDWLETGTGKRGKFVFTLIKKIPRSPYFPDSQSPRLPRSEDFFLFVSFSYQEDEIENIALQSSLITPQTVSDSQELKAFDMLKEAEQEKALKKRGPLLPKQYSLNNLSMRAFVLGNASLSLDYGLENGATATATLTVDNAQPLIIQLNPAERDQIKIRIPPTFGNKPRVGKLNIRAFTRTNEPAKLLLYGISMGEKGNQAMQAGMLTEPYLPIAMNRFTSVGLRDALFGSLIDDESPRRDQLEIMVDPKILNSREKPRKDISFSFTFRSAFSNGQWEIWRENGLDCIEVWQKRIGSISPNQTKSQKWNGRVPPRKTLSFGTHAIQLMAWHGKKTDRDWVIIRTNPNLIVVQ